MRVFANNMDRPTLWQVVRQWRPSGAVVSGFEEVRSTVVVAMPVKCQIGGAQGKVRRFNARDPPIGRNIRQLIADVGPRSAAIPADVDSAVIAAGVEDAQLER